MTATLRNYQREGVERLIEITDRRGSAILADEPGLGKTIQVIEFINRLAIDTTLIVCPASLRVNWGKELDKWLINTLQYVEVVSYEEVVNGRFKLEHYGLVVFDEAHYLKNASAKRTKACLKISADRRLFLTGTPIVNRPMDAFPILQSCGMQLTKTEYGKRYCAGKLIPIRWKPVKKYAWDFSGASNTEELGRSLRRHLMVRRTKKEVLTEIPRKIRQVIEMDIELTESEVLRVAAERLFNGFSEAAANAGEVDPVAFADLSRARLELAQSKLPHVISFAKDLLEEEDKLVIFAYHREIIDAIAEQLANSVKLYGGMRDKEKNASVENFQNGDARVFVGQITAAGTGLTLTAAHTMLFAEIDWVPGNIVQCEDRCHRFGQTEPVRIFHLTAAGSIDSRMIRTLVDKQKIIESITS